MMQSKYVILFFILSGFLIQELFLFSESFNKRSALRIFDVFMFLPSNMRYVTQTQNDLSTMMVGGL